MKQTLLSLRKAAHARRMKLRAALAKRKLPPTADGEPLGGGATFRPLTRESLAAITEWLQDPEIYKWLDFAGRNQLTADEIVLFMTSPVNSVRVIHGSDGSPIAFLSCIHHPGPHRTGTAWLVRRMAPLPPRLPDRPGEPPGTGVARAARRRMLQFMFEDLGLLSISAWALETNVLSLSVLRGLGFREFGRQRQCHFLNGRYVDRVHFDMTAADFAAAFPSKPTDDETSPTDRMPA